MTPPVVRTQLGRVLLAGGDRKPHPRDACRTPEDVDGTVDALRRAGLVLPPEAMAEARAVRRWLDGRRR